MRRMELMQKQEEEERERERRRDRQADGNREAGTYPEGAGEGILPMEEEER